MNREITKPQFIVLYVLFGVSLLAFKEVAHRGIQRAPPLWMGFALLVILFVLFLPWFLKLPRSIRDGMEEGGGMKELYIVMMSASLIGLGMGFAIVGTLVQFFSPVPAMVGIILCGGGLWLIRRTLK